MDVCQGSDKAKRDLLELRTALGMTWREIAALDEYRGIPAGTLCAIVTQGYIPPKWYHRFGITKEPPRVRLVTQVDADTRAAVHAAAAAEGVTAADWLRRVVGEALLREEEE